MSEFWSVAVDAPLSKPLTYKASAELVPFLRRGHLVQLPLGKRKARGLILGPILEKPDIELKEISAVEDEYLPLPEFFLKWLEWLSQYYFHPIGSVASLAYPPLKKAKKENSTRKPSVIPRAEKATAPDLTEEQKKVVTEILSHQGFSPHLLYGVTGSGKTEVYIRLLENTLKNKQKGLILVPEISLTPQLIQRFVSRFGDQVAVLHSQLTERERTNQWWEMQAGHKSILIGARSALFCPIDNLGLVIVDEEHEPSYKQDEKLKYNGRDAAVMLAKFAGCPVVLGSATPSLESWKNALDKKYHFHEMSERVLGRSLPEVQIVDMRDIEKKSDLPFWMSQELQTAIAETLAKKEQVALFLNRRGVAPLVICQSCGFTSECPNCDINLTLHGRSHLVCHYCDYHENFKEVCPDCKEGEMSAVGLGTELLEQEIKRLFPEARVARADRDEITNRTELEELIHRMENRQIDVLVGTQMIAKGLDFTGLTLVGLVLADVGFNLPDFRATERSFQLMTQVSGRSGRHVMAGESPGRVIIQTFNPQHPALEYAKQADFKGFAQVELDNRAALGYPPFGKIISVRLQGTDLAKVQVASKKVAQRATELKKINSVYDQVQVLGPATAPLAKVRRNYRYHILLKGPDSKILNKFCRHVFGDLSWLPKSTRAAADIDPFNLL
jgi:primosomal protein N' (replication factor Y) (superfamily II helicase)